MVVREYRESDVSRIARLYYNTIHTINARDYTPEQIEAWAPASLTDEFWSERLAKKYMVFVAEFEDLTTGFAEFEEDGHIDCFYVHHDWQRRGVGTQMMFRIEQEADELELDRLYLEASITGRPFFESVGFTVTKTEEREHNGVIFPMADMERLLER
ncbi:MAG: GNAT family N-acetyltransferase [Verrucomicrobiota bacterium]